MDPVVNDTMLLYHRTYQVETCRNIGWFQHVQKPKLRGIEDTLPETNLAPENGWLEY